MAKAIADQMPTATVARIWVFPPIRREAREWGTAVIARETGPGRFGVLTARYMTLLRGKKRGTGRVEVEEVGETPCEMVQDLVQGVQARSGENDAPAEIDPKLWFPDDDEPSAET